MYIVNTNKKLNQLKTFCYAICWLIVVAIVVFAIWFSYHRGLAVQYRADKAELSRVQSPCELQTKLLALGYDLGIKGVDGDVGGPDSCTRVAWDKAIIEQESSVWDFYYQENNQCEK